MASFLLSECLEKIFLNFIKEHSFNDIGSNIPSKELFSCTLVSRHWCRISTPLLYSYPFHHFRHKTSYNSFYKLILFNYISLIRGLIVDELMFKSQIKTIEEANYLSQFISIQKNLKHIILSENRYDLLFYSLDRLFYSNSDNKYNIVLSSLSTQSESLQILEFKNLYFVINYERVEKQGIRLFQNFPTFLISLKYLELPKIFLNELIFILKSCIKLNFLSIILSNDDLFEENLKNLANFLPKTLKRIRFRETNCSIISINSLNYFLFESILNSGCNLKYLEFNDSNGFDQDYINLTKHYGVELVKI
ncbi:hypothetical protein GLOIN_2v1884908 [Rhizophagus irregularis DAOM 181602=DAOM 197198]|nr:hypothetical protein GLOIN_2v1884908 [Rhizophagus irregularis DAOM 181602=DAOM 197198]